ncbi:glycosyltransferase family 4 protein [Pseudidiomarina sp. WS423]|uniref:glycosyltransferase family 4 protein n=1 Tax=Pseudidiomarina sp. WS423 TaxID=3425124 RepID=UPI003D6E27D3
MLKLLVIGNGCSGIDSGGEVLVNSNTGSFLNELSNNFDISFLQKSKLLSYDSDLQNFQISSSNIKYVSLPDNGFQLRQLWIILKSVRSSEFIYLFWPGTVSKIAALLALAFGRKYALYVRGQFYSNGFVDELIIKRAKFLLTVSNSLKDSLANFNSNVDTIRPMIDIDIRSKKYYEKSRFAGDEIKLLFVGRVEVRKGVFDLLEAFNILIEHGVNASLTIIGGGSAISDIRYIVQKYSIENRVTIRGMIANRDELLNSYYAADAFVFPSHDEGFPRVLYESMSMRLPIFTTFVGGIPGLMEDQYNCMRIPVRNPIETARIVQEALMDSNKLELIGNNGYRTLEEYLDTHKAEHYDLVTRGILNEQGNK